NSDWSVSQQTHGVLEYSPDGSLLAAGTHDAKVKVWHMPTGNLKTLERLGYGFVLRAAGNQPEADEGAMIGTVGYGFHLRAAGNREDLVKAGPLKQGKVNLTILRHGLVLAEQPLAADL